MEFLYEYGIFLAKSVTIVVAIAVVIGLLASAAMKQKPGKGQLEIRSISEQLEELKQYAQQVLLDKDALKKRAKAEKKAAKASKKQDSEEKKRLFVIDFKGSMDAHEVDHLREEVTAIICNAEEGDEVLVKIESGGGVVHGYGLAASQLQRIKDKGLTLTACVDKVAASGGYMMACVADKVYAAPFAIIGSIGVLAQLPNFNKLLKKNNIEFEQHTAGDYKRTLTVFGENTDEGREKFREELTEVHQMFKQHVQHHRAALEIDKVATGEYWYGTQALSLHLVDEIKTSDDVLLAKNEDTSIYSVKYSQKKNVAEKLGLAASVTLERGLVRLWGKATNWFS
ncbi:protease SohB [Alteromonas sediminis]|uniref:Protease SohB n=1 Tax=Alteromonas sediminis TaxID=2259342 RepID=A0A3N5Y2M7_9ALTE|nr:protease SohB [Alteromonas sediminis]RPJ67560.1 protease SohB [Alteromonas sediminis]